MGILISNNGTFTLPCLVLVFGVPLLVIGHYHYYHPSDSVKMRIFIAMVCITLTVLLKRLFFTRIRFPKTRRITKREEMNYSQQMAKSYPITDILQLITNVMTRLIQSNMQNDSKILPSQHQITNTIVCCMNALQRIACQQCETKENECQIMCYEASYQILRTINHMTTTDDDVDEWVLASLSLLAFVSKQEVIYKRIIKEGLKIPIESIRQALERTKCLVTVDDDKEQLSAELQRRACLYLGSLAEDNKEMATLLVTQGGMDTVLKAIDWFRHHVEVCNWGLWALFTMAYDHLGNQRELKQLNGIQTICTVLDCVLDDNDDEQNQEQVGQAVRHGIAILFDLLRYNTSATSTKNTTMEEITTLQRIALSAGMYKVVQRSIQQFPKMTEIVLMGQQMLLGTNNAFTTSSTKRR